MRSLISECRVPFAAWIRPNWFNIKWLLDLDPLLEVLSGLPNCKIMELETDPFSLGFWINNLWFRRNVIMYRGYGQAWRAGIYCFLIQVIGLWEAIFAKIVFQLVHYNESFVTAGSKARYMYGKHHFHFVIWYETGRSSIQQMMHGAFL